MPDLDEDSETDGDEPDPDCDRCDGTGHEESCESRERAESLDDLFYRQACMGCCPNGHAPTGLQALQDATALKLHRMTGR